MESWPAEPSAPLECCKAHLKECDVMVLLVGNRYGSICKGKEKSFTELEFDHALELDLPVLAFVHSGPSNNVLSIDAEDLKRQQYFLKRLGDSGKVTYKGFRSQSELVGAVQNSLSTWMRKERGKVGDTNVLGSSGGQAGRSTVASANSAQHDVDLSSISDVQDSLQALWPQVDQDIDVKFHFTLRDETYGDPVEVIDAVCGLGWRDILGALAPSLARGAYDDALKDALAHRISKTEEWAEILREHRGERMSGPEPERSEFETLLLKLKNANLIHLVRPHGPESAAEWLFTDRGDQVQRGIME